MSFFIKERGLTAGIVGAIAAVLAAALGQLSPVSIIAAIILGPLAYFGTDLFIRSRGTGFLVREDRTNAFDECVTLQRQVEGSVKALPSTTVSQQIEAIASVSQNIILAMRKDPDKMADVSNFDFNYMQPIARAVQTFAHLSQESVPGDTGGAVQARLTALFPKALSQLRKYQDALYAGDVQQLEGLVDMLEDAFPGDDATAPRRTT